MIDRLHIATRDLSEKDRLPFMRDFYGRIAMGVDIDPAPDAPFDMEISTSILPSVGLGHGTVSPMGAARGRHLTQDGNSGLLLSAYSETFHVTSNGADRLVISPGQVLAAPLDLASTWTYPAGGKITSIWIDRERLGMLAPNLPQRLTVLDRTNPLVELLYSYARIVQQAQTPSPAELALYDRHLMEIAAMVLGGIAHPEEIGAANGLRSARLGALKQDVDALFHQQDFSVGELGRRHGISARYVQMLFESEGTTFTEYLHERRLDFALRLLTDPMQAHRRIANIAFDAGFSDLSTFNRLFRRRYGDTPSSARVMRPQIPQSG